MNITKLSYSYSGKMQDLEKESVGTFSVANSFGFKCAPKVYLHLADEVDLKREAQIRLKWNRVHFKSQLHLIYRHGGVVKARAF